jgi:hypothetical protein
MERRSNRLAAVNRAVVSTAGRGVGVYPLGVPVARRNCLPADRRITALDALLASAIRCVSKVCSVEGKGLAGS